MTILVAGFLLALYVLASCTGLYLLKVAQSWDSGVFLAGAVLYAIGAGLWLVILRLFPLSTAFPVAAGALMVGTSLVGFIVLKEPISVGHVVGILAIAFGIGILAFKVQAA